MSVANRAISALVPRDSISSMAATLRFDGRKYDASAVGMTEHATGRCGGGMRGDLGGRRLVDREKLDICSAPGITIRGYWTN